MSEDKERYTYTNRDQYKGPPICLEFGAINKEAEYGEGGFVVHEAALKGGGAWIIRNKTHIKYVHIYNYYHNNSSTLASWSAQTLYHACIAPHLS